MKRILYYIFIGLGVWLILFLGWEWWRSYPKVRLTPISFPESREARLDSLLSSSLSEFLIPGLAVGIIENEKVTYLKAFGFANLETKDSMSLQTHVPVASVSKIFTALAIANFALEHGISGDSLLNGILPEGQKLAEPFGQLSLRELLSHNSGISDPSGISSMLQNQEKRKLSNLPSLLKNPNPYRSTFAYADANFDLLGYLLEVTESKPFESLAKERVLLPAGMEKSLFVTTWPQDSFSIEGHQATFLWKRIQPKKLRLARSPSPSSGLVLTPMDLSKALLHLSRGSMGTFGDELEWLKSGGEIPNGFQKIELNKSSFMGHYGDQGGYSALLVYSEELDLAIFFVSNAEDKPDFRKSIAESILKIINP